ncbi:hypothetical protein SAMN05518871_102369 [Psychrobacillus sp. OK028]|uniref:hypothetical protein n=1 Tax=Psychrobacillus sp. OK028 TaxID=1884359 RepID=UPI0008810B3A|nr:hypothetical protein [Psychrobacillus sp. OK028]SDM84156.1 hypothetical protein SAMN05518871_102369 [Psychrobacillus sp. OK028]
MKQLFPLHASIMVDSFDDIILDYEFSLVRLKENSIVCTYDQFVLEIQAESLHIKSMSSDRLHLHVQNLQFFNLTRKEKTV